MNSNRIGELLVSKGLIDKNKLRIGLEEQEKSREMLGKVLLTLGFLSETDILQMLGMQLGLPYLLRDEYPPTPPLLDNRPSLKFLKNYKVVPIELKDGVLKVATANPQDPFPVDALGVFTGIRTETVLGTAGDILDTIDAYYGEGEVTMDKIMEDIDDKEMESGAIEIDDVEKLKEMALEAPIINMVNLIITKAVERRASDIHIEPFEDMLHVRYRIDGILYVTESLPKRLHPAISSRVKIMSKLNIAEKRLPQDGRIKMRALDREVDIRVSTVPTLYGESIVMRLLDPSGIISMESLGFSESIRNAFADLIRQPYGMILVTGPTGSGKTTTLYAALSRIDTVDKNVITIEDPIEYNLSGVNQIQVKPNIGFTFANGLRSIVRQDPDVIMVGEIRDMETAEIAIHSALTGHLIFSTLHTNDAPGAVTRLADMGIEGYLISSSLLGVLAQRLVRVICENCKAPYVPGEDVPNEIRAELDHIKTVRGAEFNVFKGTGCAKCDYTGYIGRTGIFELMLINDDIRQLIVEMKDANMLRQKAIMNGMVPLREDGWDKVVRGITTIDEIVRVSMGIQG